MQADDKCRHPLADACEADSVGKDVRRKDYEQDVSGESDRTVYRLDYSARCEIAEHGAKNNCQTAPYCRALGRGYETRIDTSECAGNQDGEWQDVGQRHEQIL